MLTWDSYFFSGDLARFNITYGGLSLTRSGKKRPPRLNIDQIFETVGDGVLFNSYITLHSLIITVIIPKALSLEHIVLGDCRDGPCKKNRSSSNLMRLI